MARCLVQSCPLSFSFLPPRALVRGLGLSLGFTIEVGRGVECRMPRRLARRCPLPLYSLPAHAVVCWYVLGPREITFAEGREFELYDAAVSGTAVPASPPDSLG